MTGEEGYGHIEACSIDRRVIFGKLKRWRSLHVIYFFADLLANCDANIV